MNSDLFLRYKIQDFLDNFLCESIDVTFEGKDSFITFDKDRINISLKMIKEKPVEVQAQLCQALILHEVSHLWFTRDDCCDWYKKHKVTRFESSWINILEDFRIELKSKSKNQRFKELLELSNKEYRQGNEKMGVPQCDYIWQLLFCNSEGTTSEEQEAFNNIDGAAELLTICMQPSKIQPLEEQLKLAKLIKPEEEEEEERVTQMLQQILQNMLGIGSNQSGNNESSQDQGEQEGQNSNSSENTNSDGENSSQDSTGNSTEQDLIDDVANRLAEALESITIEPDDEDERAIYNGGATKVERTQDAIKNQRTLSYGYWNWSRGYSLLNVKKSKEIEKKLRENKIVSTKSAQRNFSGKFNLRAAMQPYNYKWFVNQEVTESCEDVLFVFDTSCASHSMSENYMKYFYRIIKSIPKEADCCTMSFNIKNIKQKGYYPECGRFIFEKFDYLVKSVVSKYKAIVLYTAQPLTSSEFKKYKNDKKVIIKSIKELTPLLTK